jgi:hypothetical protein
MSLRIFVAGLVAGALPLQPVFAQAMLPVPYGGAAPKPVPQKPPADPKDTPEEIAKDAARDLKDSRFYNKPGATRAQYDADWQECRLIARGSRTPSGTVPYYYNPAVVSPIAAGAGGALGGLIAGAIIEGQQRRANRRNCLLIKGWRLVEVPAAEQAKVAAMTDEQRSAYFNAIVGAASVEGEVTERTSFAMEADPELKLDAPVTGPSALFLGKKVDASVPLKLAPGEAAIVLGYRRPGGESTGRSGAVSFARYDIKQRDLVYQPKDWKKKGDKTTYLLNAGSADRKAGYEVQVLKVTPGDYVIMGTSVGPNVPITTSNCFGAPTFNVGEGEVLYVGDFLPYMGQKLSEGSKFFGLAYASHPEDARSVLAGKQQALAAALKPAVLRNRATYACSAINMDRWDLPGAEALPDPEPQLETASNIETQGS